jgi:hypothetical protein
MKTPNVFIHYWTAQKNQLTFQEILQWDVDPSTIQTIQEELLRQLTEQQIQSLLPNFSWESPRFVEKWASISQSLLMQIQLPEQIWMDWIQMLGGKIQALTENPPAPLEEVYPSFEELLTAEIYYERPSDSLEDIKPRIDEEIISPKQGFVDNQQAKLPKSTPEIKPMPEAKPTVKPSDQAKPAEVKNILDMYADSPTEKVFESIRTEDRSLKDRIHTDMTSSLAETLPLFQKINYIQHLFDGQSEHLDQIIRYIDHEYAQEDWKAYLNERYAAYQRAENAAIWQELFDTIERKFR